MYSTGGASAASPRSRRTRASNLAAAARGRVGLGADRQHRHRMADRGEIRPARAAHALRGRIRRHERRMLGLDRLQLAKERVVLGVRDRRRIEHVVALVVLCDRAPQRRRARNRRGRRILTVARRHGAHDPLALGRSPRHQPPKSASARALPGSMRTSRSAAAVLRTCSRIALSAASSSGRRLSSTSIASSECAMRFAATFI